MAFKEEKPQSMLSKWWQMNRALYVRDSEEPPPLIEDCHSLKEAYRWRETIMKEIGDKVAEIQNAGMGDYKIRALNDEINTLINHKRQWEQRIRQLGGPNFLVKEKNFYDNQGVELPGSNGYMYFGASKDLPGVRELFFQNQQEVPTENVEILKQRLGKDYFKEIELDNDMIQQLKEDKENYENEQLENWIFQNSDFVLNKYPDLLDKEQDEVKQLMKDINYIEWYDEYQKNDKDDIELLEQKKKELIERIKDQLQTH